MFKIKENIKTLNMFHYRTGTLLNQKNAVRYKTLTSLQCPLCHHLDSALSILSGCQYQIISDISTERHNIACRLIMKAIEAGSMGECFVQINIGSKERIVLQNLKSP